MPRADIDTSSIICGEKEENPSFYRELNYDPEEYNKKYSYFHDFEKEQIEYDDYVLSVNDDAESQSKVNSIKLKQKVLIEGNVSNTKQGSQEFAFIVQITDANGIVVKLNWITGVLVSDQTYKPQILWEPEFEDEYNISVFVWESIDNPIPLKEVNNASVLVS